MTLQPLKQGRGWFGCLGALCLMLAGCGAPRQGPDLDVILAAKAAPRLADYGLFQDAAARIPAPGVVAYDLVNPLFSDHAQKHRYVFVPGGSPAQYKETDVLSFPVGSVLVKTFAYAPDMAVPATADYYVETRLLIHKAEGWVAYPYIWNAAGNQASYRPAGGQRRIETLSPSGVALSLNYTIPNRNQCKTCHQAGDLLTPIGPTARNLNHIGPHGGPQLEDWAARGLVAGVPDNVPIIPAVWDERAPLDARARAYLDINCAHCHKADGAASNSGLWLNLDETSPVRLGIGKRPTAAGRGAGQLRYVIAAGDAAASILAFRMASDAPGVAMPELGRQTVDAEGSALVEAWIDSLEAP